MNRRVLCVASLLCLGTGCGENIKKAFVGAYSASGTRTLKGAGSEGSEEISGKMNVSEGVSSDLNFENEANCIIPAKLDGQVAMLERETTCEEYVTIARGDRIQATFTAQSLTATRNGDVITLDITGPVTATYKGIPLVGELTYNLTLTPQAQ